eukprot:TRINITY_DN2247_c0_g2_i3.p1 TRINITY_DN2247_c0_g2~~TRINITY_DN2247_c0_g2_i3.p1  ORF type:complete len:141 (-),score=31.19 TRINITY_DN2247_c0_g2_i3:40-462(-)
MTVALIGLPGGLEPRHEQLKELVKTGTIDFYEVIGREVVCYLREMGPAQTVSFKIDVEAKIPGIYAGPASRIYLYYTDESKFWTDPLKISILPADGSGLTASSGSESGTASSSSSLADEIAGLAGSGGLVGSLLGFKGTT